MDKWDRYRAATLTPNNFPPKLMAKKLFKSCYKELHKALHNVGLQVKSTEQEIIDKITENAVHIVSKLRHWCKFFKMHQEEDENSRQYGA